MELNLSPVFYTQVGATSPQTMKVLSRSKTEVQKVAIGDNSGVVTYFGMKKGDANIVFKTLPGPAITRLETGSGADRIFVSSEAMVKGFNRKGKQFLTFDTNLTEPIHAMCVEGNNLFVCGNYIYNHYVDCKDAHYYLSSDRINDILCLPPTGNDHLPVIACQDNSLRILKGSELVYEVEVAGPPLCIAMNGPEGGENGQEVLYGTQNGKMGLVKLTSSEPSYRWDMLNEKKYGGIVCLATSDVSENGLDEILVGRDDGVVEVYGLDETNEPRLRFTHVFSESIASVCGGTVGSSNYQEVVVATYGGRVFGLSREPVTPKPISQEVQAKLDSLKDELKSMERQLNSAKTRYQQALGRAQKGGSGVSALPHFEVHDKFLLNQDEAWYTLSIEIQVPIDHVMLQSDVPLDLQEVDKSSAVVSYTSPDVENNNYLLATFRSQNTNRLEVKVRSIEGQYGTLQAYITPYMEPKSCQVRQYQIKPLSLHRRIHTFDGTRPCNVLKLTGSFSLFESHSWIRYCLPDVPDQPASEGVNTLHFQSTFIDTQLECVYRKGEATFRSDNMSTISVLKEVLSKEATQKKISIKISQDLNDASVAHVLGLIFPKLEGQLMLAKNVQLIEALQEIQAHEKDTSFLSPQCQFILENGEAMQEDLKQQPCMIERLYALVTDLYMDRASFRGQNVKDKVPNLLELLDNCDLESLLEFFEVAPAPSS